jgi:hypothetical protein
MTPDALRSKDSVIRALSRAGTTPDAIVVLERELPDRVDLDRDGNTLLACRITPGRLMDELGGSP